VPIAAFANTASFDAPVDWARIDRWASEIAGSGESNVVTEFSGEYGREASLIWDPSVDKISSNVLQFLLTYWLGLRNGRGTPRPEQINPLEMRPALGYVALVDPIDGGRDFRYRLYGTVLASISDIDMTGKLLSELKASRSVRELSLASYRAALQRPQPIYLVRSPGGAVLTAQWHRLTLPLFDDAGRVIRFLTGSVPITGTGAVLMTRL